jgi:hypothetical protein
MLFVWYPGPFFSAMGGNDLVMILIGWTWSWGR